MVDSRTPAPIDVRAVGRHMSRERYQRGSLKKIGKTRKMWRGRWHVYVKQADGSEKVCKREKILGPVSELTKGQAQEKLDALIKSGTGQISGSLSADSTFAEAWKRYLATGTPTDAQFKAASAKTAAEFADAIRRK